MAIQLDFTLHHRAAEALANSRGLETDRIHFNDINDDQLICDLAIKYLENDDRSINCFTNILWSVMDLGDGTRVLLNRNSTIKRLEALGVDRDLVKAALNSHNMERIHALITQQRDLMRQEIRDNLRVYADTYTPSWFDACKFPHDSIRPRLETHIYNDFFAEQADISTSAFVQYHRSAATLEQYKGDAVNAFYERLRRLCIPYPPSRGCDIYVRLEEELRNYLPSNDADSIATTCSTLLSAPANLQLIADYARISQKLPPEVYHNAEEIIQQLIHPVITQRRDLMRQEIRDHLMTYMTTHVIPYSTLLMARFPFPHASISSWLRSRIYDDFFTEQADISTEEFMQLHRAENPTAALDQRKNQTVDALTRALKALAAPYAQNCSFYNRIEQQVRDYLRNHHSLRSNDEDFIARICFTLLSSRTNFRLVIDYSSIINGWRTEAYDDEADIIQRLIKQLPTITAQVEAEFNGLAPDPLVDRRRE